METAIRGRPISYFKDFSCSCWLYAIPVSWLSEHSHTARAILKFVTTCNRGYGSIHETNMRISMVLRNTFIAFSLHLVVYIQACNCNYSLRTVAGVTMDIATRYQIHYMYLLHSSRIQGKFPEIQPNICLHAVKYKC